MSQERNNYSTNSLEKTSTEIYSDLKALQELVKFDAGYEKDVLYGLEAVQTLDTSFVETESSFPQNNLDPAVGDSVELAAAPRSVENNEEKLDVVELRSPKAEARKCPIYAEVRKDRKTQNVATGIAPTEDDVKINNDTSTHKSALDVHTLTVLWLIFSGCNVEECLLEGNEMAGVNFGAFLPTDPKVMKLLLEAGAVEQSDVEGCDYESQISLATTSSEQSPEPIFDLQDIHGGQAALHVAARLGQAPVVKVRRGLR